MNGLEAGLYVVTGYSPAYVNQLPEAEGSQSYHLVGDSVRVEMIKRRSDNGKCGQRERRIELEPCQTLSDYQLSFK